MSPLPRPRLGELLVRAGVVTPEQVDAAAAVHRANRRTIGQQLIAAGAASELELTAALAYQLDVPLVLLGSFRVDEAAVKLTPADLARARGLLASAARGGELLVAMRDPADLEARQALAARSGRRVVALQALPSELEREIARRLPESAVAPSAAGELVPFPRAAPRPAAAEPGPAGAAPAPSAAPGEAAASPPSAPTGPAARARPADDDVAERMVRFFLADALREAASDVHVEPLADRVRVRSRIEGELRDLAQLPRELATVLVARIRALAGMRAGDARGRLAMRDAAGEATFDVSVVSTLWGDKVVLRVIERRGAAPDLEDLGLEPGILERWRELLRSPYGLLLVAGGPGMGKTTTLYASLRDLPAATKDVTTVEDPVDHALEGVHQVQVDRRSGATLAATLRDVLVQEPDVVLVSELGDGEIARLALDAALAGRLVLSSVEAADALGALHRLVAMDADRYAVSAGTVAVLAQLLLPRLCEHCRAPAQPPMVEAALLRQAGLEAERVYGARGCARCDGTGRRGRVAAFELLLPGEELRAAIQRGAATAEARAIAQRGGLVTLREAALRLVAQGQVAVADVLARLPSGA